MSKLHPIPFNKPFLSEKGLEYVRQVFERQHASGDGEFTKRCQQFFESAVGARRVLLTTSCTAALEMTAILLDLKPGDEFIVPSFTFVSTANAFVLRGAKPIFVDVRPDTLNLDERLLDSAIGPRTRAILVVHYAGIACEMDSILSIAGRRGIPVIEDNAHGLFGTYRGKPLGSLGAMATLSFHETKNLSCGEGGALLINDRALISRAEIIREKGTDRSRFFRGEVDKYTWQDVGSSFLPSDILAAVLLSQIETHAEIQARRARIFDHYQAELAGWAELNGIRCPSVPSECGPSYHMFYLLMPDHAGQIALIDHLGLSGCRAVFHYQALNTTPMGLRLGGRLGQCPVAESAADRIVRLPFFSDLNHRDQSLVIKALRSFGT